MGKPTVSVVISGKFNTAEEAIKYLKKSVNRQQRFNCKLVALGLAYAVYTAYKFDKLNKEIEELKNVKEG